MNHAKRPPFAHHVCPLDAERSLWRHQNLLTLEEHPTRFGLELAIGENVRFSCAKGLQLREGITLGDCTRVLKVNYFS